jgi:hypothetical protein
MVRLRRLKAGAIAVKKLSLFGAEAGTCHGRKQQCQ